MKQIFKAARGFLMFFHVAMGITFMMMGGCGTDDPLEPMEPSSDAAVETFGMVRAPAAGPAAPQLQVPEGTPTVKSVGYYSDWKLTKPIGSAFAGDTIYTKVVFSEPMQHIAAADKTARPVLYYQIGRQSIRYRIQAHGAKGAAFQSGDAKPKGKSTTTFVCKYTIQTDTTGTFTLAVGKLSADTDGNTLSAFYTHTEKVRIQEPDTTPPFVQSVTYWHDKYLTKPITDTVYRGEDIYTKIVFSEEMKVVGGNNKQSRPVLYYRIDRQNIRYRIRLSAGLLDGGASTEDGITFICRNIVPDTADGTLQIAVGKLSADLQGNTLSALYTHRERVHMKTYRPPTVLAGTGVVNVNHRPCVRLVYFYPKDQSLKQDKVETLRRLTADANKRYADEMQQHGFGRKTFAVETDRDGVPVVHIIRGRFSENHYRPTGRHHRGVYTARAEILEHFSDDRQHIYFFMMDLTQNAFSSDPGCWAFGGLHFVDQRREKDVLGGYAILPAWGWCSESLPITLHELGHAFGLHHDFRDGRGSDFIMAYGRQSHLSQDAAAWLSVSVFFNDSLGLSPGTITRVPDPEHTPQGVKIRFQAEDPDRLHQMQLLFREGSGYTLIDFAFLQGNTDTATFVSPKVTRQFTKQIILQIIDKEGGITQARFPAID